MCCLPQDLQHTAHCIFNQLPSTPHILTEICISLFEGKTVYYLFETYPIYMFFTINMWFREQKPLDLQQYSKQLTTILLYTTCMHVTVSDYKHTGPILQNSRTFLSILNRNIGQIPHPVQCLSRAALHVTLICLNMIRLLKLTKCLLGFLGHTLSVTASYLKSQSHHTSISAILQGRPALHRGFPFNFPESTVHVLVCPPRKNQY